VSGPAVLACASCFGAADSPLIDGARAGAFFLIGVILAMQGAFAGFFFYLRSRAKRAQSRRFDREWSALQQTRTTR
jgi:hypothetical protein